MPESIETLVWVVGTGVIAILISLVGWLVTRAVNNNTEEVKNLRADINDERKERVKHGEQIVQLSTKVEAMEKACGEHRQGCVFAPPKVMNGG